VRRGGGPHHTFWGKHWTDGGLRVGGGCTPLFFQGRAARSCPLARPFVVAQASTWAGAEGVGGWTYVPRTADWSVRQAMKRGWSYPCLWPVPRAGRERRPKRHVVEWLACSETGPAATSWSVRATARTVIPHVGVEIPSGRCGEARQWATTACTRKVTLEHTDKRSIFYGALPQNNHQRWRQRQGVRVTWNARWHRRPPPLVSIRSHRWDGADLIRAHGQSSLYRTSSSDGAWRSSSPLTLRPDGVTEDGAGRGRGRQGGGAGGIQDDGPVVQQRQRSAKKQWRGERRQKTRNTRFTSWHRADAWELHPDAIDPP